VSRPTRRAVIASFGAAIASGTLTTAMTGNLTSPVRPGTAAAVVNANAAPLRHAHAHNDYWHPRPLADALVYGFTSVEADIWLAGGQLLVGHNRSELTLNRTLEALYLEPLLARVRAHRGVMYSGYRLPLQLLIDIKNAGEETYRELHRRLHRYRSILSTASAGRVLTRAVTVVVTGDRAARAPLEAQRQRYAFYDGRLGDLGGGISASSMTPLISSDWGDSFRWRGSGPMPAEERSKLHSIVSAAYAGRQRLRFWGTPDAPGGAREAVWRELLDAGVDYISTDDLAGLARFLHTYDRGNRNGE
jgi:hypothetical protein